MPDRRTRRQKLEAMARQTVSPHEAEIARRILAEMDGPRPPLTVRAQADPEVQAAFHDYAAAMARANAKAMEDLAEAMANAAAGAANASEDLRRFAEEFERARARAAAARRTTFGARGYTFHTEGASYQTIHYDDLGDFFGKRTRYAAEDADDD